MRMERLPVSRERFAEGPWRRWLLGFLLFTFLLLAILGSGGLQGRSAIRARLQETVRETAGQQQQCQAGEGAVRNHTADGRPQGHGIAPARENRMVGT